MFARLQPYGLLIGRVMLGVVFIAHGWQKFADGIDHSVQSFESLGIPAPALSAYFTATAELVGGVLLIVGALMPLTGLVLAGIMLGAMYFVHLDGGFYSRNGGFEYVLTLAALSVAIGFSGGGAWALDKLWLNKKDEAAEPAPAESAV
ncbi:DoxX family protein [Glycomyces paridis]|uniref:DoxX family protein n=1 Tax=Glycomyces paridis TaxID=2126555 RepID=A0A4S8PLT6_9ACTN|nr:DoxX family protein [Glycomyces paridis]THV30622.1 DoxX family protein [Glycomyces paridis]